MMNFFKKIRRSSSSKYLKYAIGEIFLVTIGILIAIQFNAYYESKKREKESDNYLAKLLIELQYNSERLEFIIENSDSSKYDLKRALNGIERLGDHFFKSTITEENIPELCNITLNYGGSIPNLKDISYQELVNTGKLYSLGSDTLIESVVNYYKHVDREVIYIERNINELAKARDLMRPTWRRLCSNYFIYEYYELPFDLKKQYDWVNQPDSEGFLNTTDAISIFYNHQAAILNEFNDLKLETISLATIVSNELERRNR